MDAFEIVDVALRRGFTSAQVREALATFSDEDVARLAAMFEWSRIRHEYQVIPPGDWKVWLAIAGRGTGKTRLGSEWTWMWTASQPRMSKPVRHLVAAPTASDLIDTCYEGDSGLMSCIPSCLIKSYLKTPRPRIILHNGAIIGGIAAEQPARFRGPQWHRAWADEVGAWSENGRDDEYAWQMMEFSVRLGNDSRILVTTTPKPRPLLRKLIADPANVMTSAPTHVNLKNLDKKFQERILKYDGTKIGRQEIYAEFLNPEEGGVVSRDQIRVWPRSRGLPKLEFIVMSLDTAYSEKDRDKKKNENDPTANSVWGAFKYQGKPGVILLDCWQEWLKFPDLVDRVKIEQAVRYGADAERPVIVIPGGPRGVSEQGHPVDLIVIETKASGTSLRQQLAKDGIL
ncbi:MAG: DNA-packaging protein, partial [Bradyrhizobium sp.]|nr:DNA-packaging protein [Bradyrhizobium sp.]